jgi:hypothetical protein
VIGTVWNITQANQNKPQNIEKHIGIFGTVDSVNGGTILLTAPGELATNYIIDASVVKNIETDSYLNITLNDIKQGDSIIAQGSLIDGDDTIHASRIISFSYVAATSTMATTTATSTDAIASTTESVASSTPNSISTSTQDVASSTPDVSTTTPDTASSIPDQATITNSTASSTPSTTSTTTSDVASSTPTSSDSSSTPSQDSGSTGDSSSTPTN